MIHLLSFAAGGAFMVACGLLVGLARTWRGPLHVLAGVALPLPGADGWRLKRTRFGRYLVHPNGVEVYVGLARGPLVSVGGIVFNRSWASRRYRAAVLYAYMSKVALLGKDADSLLLEAST